MTGLPAIVVVVGAPVTVDVTIGTEVEESVAERLIDAETLADTEELPAETATEAAAPLVVKTLRELMVQYASAKAEGLFWTKDWQVPWDEHWLSAAQTDGWPAQSPQNVVSKISCWLLKWSSMVQPWPPWKFAVGVPHPAGSGELPLASAGAVPLGKNQILMEPLVHSMAYTPPPLLLNPSPYELAPPAGIPQPLFARHEEPAMEQPSLVCMVMVFPD